jgi:hypothetical protein
MRYLRQRGWLFWLAVVAALLIVGSSSFLAFQYATAAELGEVFPEVGAVLDSAQVDIFADVPRFKPDAAEVLVLVDGRPVPEAELELVPGGVRLQREFGEGPHNVRVELAFRNLFAPRLVQAWGFTVDTVPPEVELLEPQPEGVLGSLPTRLRARFSEPVSARLTMDGEEIALESQGRDVWADLSPEEGKRALLLTGEDQAGHRVEKHWEAWADAEPPVITLTSELPETWKKTSGEIRFAVAENLPDGLQVEAVLNGQEAPLTETSPPPQQGTEANAAEPQAADQDLGEQGTAAEKTRSFKLTAEGLAEGTQTLILHARDRGGHRVTQELSWLVDSTDVFGSREMVEGARGADARQLNRVLANKGYLKSEVVDVFDFRTIAALADFKKARGLPGKGVLDRETLPLLLGSIRIDLSERRLYHYDDGQLVKSYPVAIGQPQYPTPTGSFRIINKAKNPTWTPPPSPWAEGLEPVPPGPNNPLGTRWMGISSPSVGIHGTYASRSIGTAASHGCIRMHIPDVEELFDRVYVGTSVTIVP